MNIQWWFNFFGMGLNIAGTIIMYKNTPPIFRGAMIYGGDTVSEDLKKQRRVRRGMFILCFGFFLQFFALLLSCKTKSA